MRVLFIDVNCKSGSTGKIVYGLHNQLINDGHTSAICYGRGPLVNELNICKFSSDYEVYFHALLTRVTGITGCYSFFSTRKLINFIDEFKPDVVHVHELHAYFINLRPLINYLKKNNIKTVWTFHCEFMYTGKCGYAYECERWKTECGKCPHIRDYPASLFMDFTKKMHNDKKDMFKNFNNLQIVTPSKWLETRVRQSFLNNKNIMVIPNGIDTDNVFHPRTFENLKERHHITNEKIILAVAPNLMDERKGGRLVLELARKMRKENIKFILIGVNDLSEKFDDNVIVLGKTENQIELSEYYSLADVFVICSKRENFPTTCIEALCCGTPVCGFDEGGTKETAPGDLGIFVQYGDMDALENAALKMLSRPEIKKECSKYGIENYSAKSMYENYKKLYLNNIEGNFISTAD